MDFFKELIEINNSLTWNGLIKYDKNKTHNYRLFTLSKDYMIPFYEKKIMRSERSNNLSTTLGEMQPSIICVNGIN